jgi:hypothetical protein
MRAPSRGIRVATAATFVAALVASLTIGPVVAATCPSGFANGPYGTLVPYCADVTSAPADGATYITLAFIAPTPVVEQLNVTTSLGAFIGGTGVFAATTFPTTQVQLTTISMDSQLRLSSDMAGTVEVTVSYVDFGTTHLESVTSFTFTAVPQSPAKKADCMADGWREVVDGQGLPFRNQGACIAWVAGNVTGP